MKDSAFTFKDKHHTDESKKKIGEESKNRKRTKSTGDLISKSKKGKTLAEQNSQFGTAWINNGIVNKKVKKEELETYLQDGWIRGGKRTLFNRYKNDRKES